MIEVKKLCQLRVKLIVHIIFARIVVLLTSDIAAAIRREFPLLDKIFAILSKNFSAAKK